MSRDLHEDINVHDPGIADDQYLPQSTLNQASHGLSNFVDGSGPIFSMYLETATEEDKKMVENWKADADGILIFTGLFSAAVASLISVTIQDIRPNPQDTSNFYLANIYQTVANPNPSNISSSLPPSPPPFSPPNYAVRVNALWFLSLVVSLTCALLVTLLQQWARRYLKATQPHYSPHKRARIRAFFFEGVDKYLLPWVVDALPTLLHVSLFLFFGGLVVFLCNVDLAIFALVLSWVGVCTAVYGCITFFPIFRHDSPYSTPLTSLAWAIVIRISYVAFRALRRLTYLYYFSGAVYHRFRSLEKSYRKQLIQGMQKTAEETALNSPPEIDARAFMWTFGSLDEDHELARFFSGLPGFRSSKVVNDPLPNLTYGQKLQLLDALIGLSDRTFSSDLLPEPVKTRRAAICAKALDPVEIDSVDLHILQDILSRRRRFEPVESVGIANLLMDWGFCKGEDVSTVAPAVVSSVVAKACRRDDLWFAIASDDLGLPEIMLRDYAACGDSLSLAILVHVTRRQFSHFWKRSWPRYEFPLVLEIASDFNVQDTLPELQHEFCALWNQIVLKAQNDTDWSMAGYILARIRNVYMALHYDPDSASTQFSTFTDDQDNLLWDPTTYPVCSVAGHIHDDSASTTSPRIAVLASAFLASPDGPSSYVPAPLHVGDGRMDVPPFNNDMYLPGSYHLTRHTILEIPHIPAASLDPATAGAIRDAITPDITIPHPTPETSTSTLPLFILPPAAVTLQHNPDLQTPPDPPNLPSSNQVLDNTLPTGLSLSSHLPITRPDLSSSFPGSYCSIIVATAPDASPGPTSALGLGPGAEGDGGPKPFLRKEKETLDPLPMNRALQANTMAAQDLLPQSPSLPSVTDSDVVVVGPTPREPDVERSRDHPPYPSHDRYDIV